MNPHGLVTLTQVSVLTCAALQYGWAQPGGQAGRAQGAISGVVVDESGAAVPDAWILYQLSRNARYEDYRWVPLEDEVGGMVKANPSGGFRIANLPPGFYSLHAIPPRQGLLTTYNWGGPYPYVPVKMNQETTGLRMMTPSGVILRFRVDDPLARFGNSPGHTIGVRSTEGVYKDAPLRSRTGGVAEFSVTVPKRTSFRLLVVGGNGLADAAGNPLPLGAPSLPITTADEAEQVINLRAR